MKTKIDPIGRSKAGYALLVTLTFIGIMLVLFGTMMMYTVSNANLTKRNNQYNASEAAAEAATENVLSQMTHDFENESLSNSGAYYGAFFLPTNQESSWPIRYTYSNPSNNNTAGQISVWLGPWTTNTVPLNSQYTGLYGLEEDCTITASATPTTGPAVPSTVSETVQFALIPLFQFAIFYNMNLEIAAAADLNIQGAVFSNAGLWSGSSTITFSSTVSAVGMATNGVVDPFVSWGSGYSGSGKSTYTLATQPTSGNDTITMPIGTNNNPSTIEAIVNIPPTNYMMNTASAFSTNGQLYLVNEADLYLTNFMWGTNWNASSTTIPLGSPMALYYQDSLNAPNYLTWATNDYYIVSNFYRGVAMLLPTNYVPLVSLNYANGFQGTNGFQFTNGIPRTINSYIVTNGYALGTNYVWYIGYSFLTNVVYYDWREGWNGGSGPPKAVQAVQFDMRAYNKWMTNTAANGGSTYNNLCNLSSHKSHPLDSIYLWNDVNLTGATLPAVRIVNGGMMPVNDGTYGFTVATAMPIYVWGDYNASNSLGSSLSQNSTTYTEPAALMGDSVTVLSDSWSDSTSKDPGASQTTIDAACLEGIVESTNNPASDASGYSGGVENFLRLLENWSGVNLYYNGSIVVMFPSEFATNCWQQTGGYYTAASRKWAFDTNFTIGADLPPLTPKSQGVIRGTWNVN
jgi:hypothetical protein